MQQIPDVRVSFLSVMTSLAAGPRGSRFILAQFRTNAAKPELEQFTWKKLFQSVVAYCRWGSVMLSGLVFMLLLVLLLSILALFSVLDSCGSWVLCKLVHGHSCSLLHCWWEGHLLYLVSLSCL